VVKPLQGIAHGKLKEHTMNKIARCFVSKPVERRPPAVALAYRLRNSVLSRRALDAKEPSG
jgi:hypothetical protein